MAELNMAKLPKGLSSLRDEIISLVAITGN